MIDHNTITRPLRIIDHNTITRPLRMTDHKTITRSLRMIDHKTITRSCRIYLLLVCVCVCVCACVCWGMFICAKLQREAETVIEGASIIIYMYNTRRRKHHFVDLWLHDQLQKHCTDFAARFPARCKLESPCLEETPLAHAICQPKHGLAILP